MGKHRALRRAIVEVIAEERRRQKLSKRALSLKLGEYEGYVHAIETFQHVLKAEEFVVIAEGLGCAPSRLLVRAIRRSQAKT